MTPVPSGHLNGRRSLASPPRLPPVHQVTLAGFRSGKFNVLVATDVAARGLDITGVELVVQLEPPKDPEVGLESLGAGGVGCHLGGARG